MVDFEPPGAEKLIFSDKTSACLNDCSPKHIWFPCSEQAQFQTPLEVTGCKVCISNSKVRRAMMGGCSRVLRMYTMVSELCQKGAQLLAEKC